VDEFRLFTHPEACPCYNCQVRPHLDDKRGERWEGECDPMVSEVGGADVMSELRLAELKRGRYMVSWAAVKDFKQRVSGAHCCLLTLTSSETAIRCAPVGH
jgi:hypothetical protein